MVNGTTSEERSLECLLECPFRGTQPLFKRKCCSRELGVGPRFGYFAAATTGRLKSPVRSRQTQWIWLAKLPAESAW